MDDDALFRQEFSGIIPLAQDKAELSPAPDSFDYRYRRDAAIVEKTTQSLLSDALEIVDNNAVVGFKRDGIQQGVYKKLRLGKYESQARLDLHGMTVDRARQEVVQFLVDCINYDLRVVTIVHGKGTRSEAGIALLKSHCLHWLTQIDTVQACHSAQPQHGGSGAMYVLLRKSESAKQHNREQHGGK